MKSNIMGSNNLQFSGNKDFIYNLSDLDAMSYAVNYHRNIIKAFKPFLGKRILEVGAGSGNLAEVLINDYDSLLEIVLLEPDLKTFTLLTNKFKSNSKVKVINSFSKDLRNFDGYFDSIIYNNVLEHVEDDIEEIRTSKKFLKNKGYVCAYSPAIMFLYSNFDNKLGHYRRYTKKDKIELFDSNKMNIKVIKYSDLIGFFLWILKFKILKSNGEGNFPKQVRFFDKYLLPINIAVEKIINLPFGKNILVVAQKVN